MALFADMYSDYAIRSYARSVRLWGEEINDQVPVWVFGTPAIGEFKNGSFEDDPDGPPWATYEFHPEIDTDGKAWDVKLVVATTEGEHITDLDDDA